MEAHPGLFRFTALPVLGGSRRPPPPSPRRSRRSVRGGLGWAPQRHDGLQGRLGAFLLPGVRSQQGETRQDRDTAVPRVLHLPTAAQPGKGVGRGHGSWPCCEKASLQPLSPLGGAAAPPPPHFPVLPAPCSHHPREAERFSRALSVPPKGTFPEGSRAGGSSPHNPRDGGGKRGRRARPRPSGADWSFRTERPARGEWGRPGARRRVERGGGGGESRGSR